MSTAGDAFTSEAQKILTLLRRQQDTVKSVEAATGRPTRSIANGPAGSVPLSGELLDELVVLYEPRGEVGGYALRKGLPALTLRVERRGAAYTSWWSQSVHIAGPRLQLPL